MYDLVKKSYLAGLGALTVTKEKIEEVVDELVRRGEVAEKDRGQVVDDLTNRARQEKQKLVETVRERVEKIVRDMGLATRDELQELTRRVERLERQAAAAAGGTEESDAGSAEGA